MDMELETLELAFQKHMLERIANADCQVLSSEQAVVAAHAPAAMLDEAGLRTAESVRLATIEALSRLPAELPIERRLAIVSGLLEVCVVDGDLDHRESRLLLHIARLLEIDEGTFSEHLDSMSDLVSTLDEDVLSLEDD